MSERGHRGPKVCRLLGLSYRNLDYWIRTDVVTPSVSKANGSGSVRLFSAGDVLVLAIIRRLLDAGLSLGRVREHLDEIRAARSGRLVIGGLAAGVITVVDIDAVVSDLVRAGVRFPEETSASAEAV